MSEEEKAELEELYENSEWWHNRFNAVQRDYEELKKRNKELKEDKKKAREYIKNNTYFKDNVVKTMIFKDFSNDLLEILGDKE